MQVIERRKFLEQASPLEANNLKARKELCKASSEHSRYDTIDRTDLDELVNSSSSGRLRR